MATMYNKVFDSLFYDLTKIVKFGLDVNTYNIRIGYPLTDGRSVIYGEIRLKRRRNNLFNKILHKGSKGILYLYRPKGSIKNVFVDNKKVKTRVKLKPTSTIEIGRYSVDLSGPTDNQRYREILHVTGIEVKWDDKIALHKIDIELARGDIMAVMGPSGCGKSTLLKAISGQITPSGGAVFISGHNISDHYNQVKKMLGYVPQDDIVHKELTIDNALYFTCKFKGIRPGEIAPLTTDILGKLKLSDKRHNTIENLSGGERKRVSVAVELVDQPEILLMDEPTSPLDPETTEEFMEQIQALAREANTAVLLVTHKPDDLRYANKVVFLAKGGYQIYNGSKEEFLDRVSNKHFHIRNATVTSVYERFSNPENGKLYQLESRTGNGKSNAKSSPIKKKEGTFLSQLFWLTVRYFKIKFPTKYKDSTNESFSLRASVRNYTAQVLVIALVMIFIFPQFNMGVLFVISISSVWFALSNASKEIVCELDIYNRERMYNLYINGYLFSKIFVLLMISAYQIFLLIAVVFIHYEFYNGDHIPSVYLRNPISTFVYLLAASLAATALGLLLSACGSKAEKVLILIPIVLLPQIILSGVVAKLDSTPKEIASYAALGRWSLEGLSHIQDDASGSRGSVVLEHFTQPNQPPKDSTSTAIGTLGIYNDNFRIDGTKSWTFLKSIDGNYLALLVHFFAAYVGCVILLRKKGPKQIIRTYKSALFTRATSSNS